jgi:hypothetical protein
MPGYDGDGQVRDGAWAADITCPLGPDGWPAGMRVIVRWLVVIVITSGLLDDTTMPPHAARAIGATSKVMCWLPSSYGFQLAGMRMS